MVLHNPDYEALQWQGTLFSVVVISTAVIVNILVPGAVPKFEIEVIAIHVAGFVVIVSILWTYGTHADA